MTRGPRQEKTNEEVNANCGFQRILLSLLRNREPAEGAKQDPGMEPDSPETANVPEETESEVLTIVRGDNSSAAVTEAAKNLRRLLESQNYQVDIKTDWVKRGEEIKPFPNEILVGPTNRPGSEELYAKIAETGETYDYFIQVGAVNCIAATDDCIGEAVELFAEEYTALRSGGNMEETKEMERLHVFPARGMTLCGVDLSEWSIVCPAAYHTEDRAELELLASLFYEACGNKNYQEHIDEFFSTVEPPYASVDIYPCDTTGLYGGYMDNLDVFASACRRAKTPFSVYLQSVSFAASKRTPSEKDLEWQTWCIRSFGAAEAIYFTYMTPYSTAEDFKPALIDHNLERTDRWYAAQKINGEFAALDPAFARYPENLGAFTVNASETNISQAFMRFSGQYDFSAVLEEIESEAPLLFVCFTDGADGYAFTVVSCQNLLRDKTADMRLKFAGKALTVWQNGMSSRLEPDGEGYITISLACGEGAFCEIER